MVKGESSLMSTIVEATPNPEIQSAASTDALCRNCGLGLQGKYCHGCGQKRIDKHEFALKHFFSHLLHEITHLDSNKILRTFFTLLFRPGLLTSEYLAGRKGIYINPIRVYLTFSAIYFLFAWTTLSDVRGGGAARTARSPATIAVARQKGVDPQVLADTIYRKTEKFAGLLRFASVLVSGLFLSLLFLGLRKYYVEHLVFSLHFYSFDFLTKSLFAVVFLVAATLGYAAPSRVLDLFYLLVLLYLVIALRRVYQQSWLKTISKALVLFVLEIALFIAINIAGFMLAFAFV